MGAMTAIMVGLGAASAVQQFSAGQAAKTEAEYNASQVSAEAKYNSAIYAEQAQMIQNQADLQAAQDDRGIRFAAAKHVAVTAAKGLQLSGSAMAVLADTMTQLEMDKAIGQYNFAVQKRAVQSQGESVLRKGMTLSEQYRRGGETAAMAGTTGALTTAFNTAAYVGMRNVNTSAGAKTGKGA